MAKKVFLSFLALLTSCNEIVPESETIQEVTIEYPSSFIQWSELFTQESNSYFIYVFAYDCYYCNLLKKKVICFHETCKFPVYFCEYTKSIPIAHDIDNTIGKNKIDDVFIKGTPTLILINEKSITFNVAGKEAVSEMIDLHLKNE